jgi:hypothetical protein
VTINHVDKRTNLTNLLDNLPCAMPFPRHLGIPFDAEYFIQSDPGKPSQFIPFNGSYSDVLSRRGKMQVWAAVTVAQMNRAEDMNVL